MGAMYEKTYVPYGAYWSTPFVKWQGSFAHMHPLTFTAEIAARALSERNVTPDSLTGLYLGMTVPSKGSFYGAPWLAGLLGAEGITGPTISQACATSASVINSAASQVELSNGDAPLLLCLCGDRTSNGPHMLYPNPTAPGGRGDAEDWVWDNFNQDPFANLSMLQTAENVARACGISTEEQHQAVLIRHTQYQSALENDSAFHKKFMVTPIELKRGRKTIANVESDEGVFPTSAEGLANLKPVMPDGTVTFGGQTYPADGNAGMLLTTKDQARALSTAPEIEIRLLGYAQGRAKKGFMPMANAPAVRRVLDRSGVALKDIRAIKTHNPFAVNDCYLSSELGIPLEGMNNFGSSLIWGHPQGPTGMRLMIELIEELVLLGGGLGLFTGCAAGDTAAALVLEVA